LEESRSKINSTDFNLINYIPARLQESWMKLSDDRKREILAEAKMFIIKEEANRASRMTGCQSDRKAKIAKGKAITVFEGNGIGLTKNTLAEKNCRSVFDTVLQKLRISVADVNGNTRKLHKRIYRADVIKMTVRQKNRIQMKTVLLNQCQDLFTVAIGIDQNGFTRLFVTNQICVGSECTRCYRIYLHTMPLSSGKNRVRKYPF
jgi:hypothetical protein